MTRSFVPFETADLSGFAKSLRAQLAHRGDPAAAPSHVELLNMLARAAGHRNFQSLRARGPRRLEREPVPPLGDTALKALRLFDQHGRLLRWPVRRTVQQMMLWGLWMRFESRRTYRERDVNLLLNAWHHFGDPCTLRRELVMAKLLTRTPDGAVYRKLPARPGDEARAFLHALRASPAPAPARVPPAAGPAAPGPAL